MWTGNPDQCYADVALIRRKPALRGESSGSTPKEGNREQREHVHEAPVQSNGSRWRASR